MPGLDYEGLENTMVGNQAGPSGSHLLDSDDEHGKAVLAAADIRGDLGVPNQDTGIWFNVANSRGQANQGANDVQHHAAAEGDLNTQSLTAVQQVITGTDTDAGSGTGAGTSIGIGLLPSPVIRRHANGRYDTFVLGDTLLEQGIWYNPNFRQATAAQPTGSNAGTVNDAAGVQAGPSQVDRRGSGPAIPHGAPSSSDKSENTCLWIARLPADCSLKDLLSSAAGCGKVYSANISKADVFYEYAAANLTFWDLAGLAKFIKKVRLGQFVIKGLRPTVNRNKFVGKSKDPSSISRVVVVAGSCTMISQAYLEHAIFTFFYELEEVISRLDFTGLLVLEFRFASVIQAEEAVEKLSCFKGLTLADGSKVEFHYGDDPCAKDVYV
ncbi:hypothetical protein O1611_g3501 [Lasiodiplodia mahajangana]|uniref:Uncharacterized protein n=1 Tax=Lasiodiplodia mahajangana TaxID=1108764 RepID=A0ACC2JRM4_9PEZI|nr:hypothetical protein O1611_g3501 [Lasiodiplodia mahajangana]